MGLGLNPSILPFFSLLAVQRTTQVARMKRSIMRGIRSSDHPGFRKRHPGVHCYVSTPTEYLK
jgi:hypothetical protein